MEGTEAHDTCWPLMRVKDICGADAPAVYGILQPGPDIAGGIPYVRPKEIINDSVTLESLRRTSPEIASKYQRSQLKAGDVILSIVGTIGKVAIVPENLEGGNITQSSVRIRALKNYAGPEFIAYALKSPQLKAQFEQCRMGAAVTRLNVAHVRNLQIPLPPLPEQERIVAILDEAFAAMATATANAEKNLANARELFESQLERAFSGGDSGDVVMEGWQQKRLGDICVVDWGNTKLTKKAFIEDGPYLGVSAAGCDGRMGHAEHTKYTPVLSAIGARCGRMFLPDEDFTAIKNTITLTPLEGLCTGVFLFNLLSSVELPKRGAAQPFISKGDIQDFIVPLPPLPEQERIVAILDEASAQSKQLEQISTNKLDHLTNLKQSLLHKAFTGELTADKTAADRTLSETAV
jgi:restriction endonuclease S subunit